MSNPKELDLPITEPDTGMDPRGCLCFTAAEDQLLHDGISAAEAGDPLPAGYEVLHDELVAAARLRCTELAIEHEPPVMYTDCLTANVSLPYPNADATCTVCIEAGVWDGSKNEVECPPGLEDATVGAPGTSGADATITGYASVDETASSDDSGLGLRRSSMAHVHGLAR